MIEKSTINKVLELFFVNPSIEFHLRELSRLLKLSMPTIVSTTDILSKEKMVIKTKGKVLTRVIANRENVKFVRHKRVYNLEQIYVSGFVDILVSKYNQPKNIILFGSFSRGEDNENSDIDIGIVTNKKIGVDVSSFEKALKRKITIHEIDINKVSGEFKANLANGVVLEGSW